MTSTELFAPDRRTTIVAIIAGAVGLAIGLGGITQGPLLAALVRLPAYVIACMCIVRFVPLVRARVFPSFVAHEASMAVIAASWAVAGEPPAVIVNTLWMVSAGIWYWRGAPAS